MHICVEKTTNEGGYEAATSGPVMAEYLKIYNNEKKKYRNVIGKAVLLKTLLLQSPNKKKKKKN